MIPLRVCLMSTDLSPNGAETQLCRLACRLKASGHEVSVISMRPAGGLVGRLEAAGIAVETLGMRPDRLNVRAPGRLWRILRHRRPEILATFNYHANIAGRTIGALAGVPVILTSIRTSRVGSRLRELSLRMTDGLGTMTCTNSQTVASMLTARGIVREERLRFIPNALDLTAFQAGRENGAAARARAGLGASGFLWLAVGRLEPAKNYASLLRAIAALKASQPEFVVQIAGQGPLLPQLTEMAASLGVERHVSFLGFQKDIPALMRAADGLVLSSAWEGLPNAVMEALAAGTPVVATDVGGVRELVHDGRSGYVVPPNDESALTQAMARLMNAAENARGAMGQSGREHIHDTYDAERVTSQWVALFDELLQQKGLRVSSVAEQSIPHRAHS